MAKDNGFVEGFGVPVGDIDLATYKAAGIKVSGSAKKALEARKRVTTKPGTKRAALKASATGTNVRVVAYSDPSPKGDEMLELEYDGETYEVPLADDWDIDVIEAAEQGKAVTSVRLLLGEKQWATFRKEHKTQKQLGEFFEHITEAVGAELGD